MQPRKLLSSSSVKDILDGFIDDTEFELSDLKEETPITVRFVWNQNYAWKTKKLGKWKLSFFLCQIHLY